MIYKYTKKEELYASVVCNKSPKGTACCLIIISLYNALSSFASICPLSITKKNLIIHFDQY